METLPPVLPLVTDQPTAVLRWPYRKLAHPDREEAAHRLEVFLMAAEAAITSLPAFVEFLHNEGYNLQTWDGCVKVTNGPHTWTLGPKDSHSTLTRVLRKLVAGAHCFEVGSRELGELALHLAWLEQTEYYDGLPRDVLLRCDPALGVLNVEALQAVVREVFGDFPNEDYWEARLEELVRVLHERAAKGAVRAAA